MTGQRRLAAILVADVVGYSKLVGSDEAGTLARLQALRRDIIDPAIARHSGRLFKAVGDGFLVEFASAVQAVTAARAIQEANAGGGMPLRIGIHVGDVVVQGDDLMGDGVNIAARVEGVAEAGGIAISRAVHEQVRDKLDLSFVDKGEVLLKNLARPVHVFAWGEASPMPAVEMAPALALPDKPSIAVLPFQNMSGDPEQEYFVDGLVEDIITALSRFKSLFVIARNSSFTYKGKAVDIKQVGRELGVRYVLEGSVRKAAGRVRITGQLIETASGAHLWADRFDGALEDVFDLQDKVTASVVGAIAPKLDQSEIDRAKRKPIESLDAYDCLLHGMALYREHTREGLDRALVLFYRAIDLAPDLAAAYGWAARAYGRRQNQGWVVDKSQEEAETRRLALRVADIGRDDAFALCAAGFALVRVCRDLEMGGAMIDQALAVNPNLAFALQQQAFLSLWLGRHEAAIEQATRALHLSPLDPESHGTEMAVATAHLYQCRFDEAARWAGKVMRRLPNWVPAMRIVACSRALAGNLDEARKVMTHLRRADPAVTIASVAANSMVQRPQDLEILLRGLRLAGLPE